MKRLYTGFGLRIGFIDHLQIVITSNYSAIANSHTPQFTVASTKSSWVCYVFTNRCVVTAFNGGRCPYSGFPNCPCASNYQLLTATAYNDRTAAVLWRLTNSLHSTVLTSITLITFTNYPGYNISARTAQKTPFLCFYIHCCEKPSAQAGQKTLFSSQFIGAC
jgi:hypothetical protein